MSAFRIDSDEGRDVIMEIVPADLESEEALEVIGIRPEVRDDRPRMRFRLTNDEAAELYYQLRREIGEWASERDAAARRFRREPWLVEDLDDVSDPDHPRHAEALADNADWSRKAERENR